MSDDHSNQLARQAFAVRSVVGIGCGGSEGSITEQALKVALNASALSGADVELFGFDEIMSLPLFGSEASSVVPQARKLVDAVRGASGVIIASPGYHGSISGAVKNAIDYIQQTWRDPRPYLTDVPIGLIAVAGGYQAAAGTLSALRAVAHALRGWPTPMGVALNSNTARIVDGACDDAAIQIQLELVGRQVSQFMELKAQCAA